MRAFNSSPKRTLVGFIALCIAAVSYVAQAQQTGQQGPVQTADVIRINTELVQTDLMVVDKQGRFVDGLRPEQFELSLDGKPQEVSFFERVKAGSSREAAQLAATRSVPNAKSGAAPANTAPLSPGRLIFFFLDDVHLSAASLSRARRALANYVDTQMDSSDLVAIASTSGQIGFLQQLSDNPAVLHAAISRLGYKPNTEAYTGKTQITEYMASQILDSGNRELYAYLLESIKIEQQSGPGSRHGDHRVAASYSAAPYLRNRLRQISAQGRLVTADTLSSFQSLMQSSAGLPGRKVVFFLSDGFIINERRSGALEALQRVTEAAERARAVIYTMDLRNSLFNMSSGIDATSNDYIDLTARQTGLGLGSLTATREPLRILAEETGGRAVLNSGAIDDAIRNAIDETSDYYLLAWRPESDEQRSGKSRIHVNVKGRPDLTVRLRSSYFVQPRLVASPDKAEAKSSKANESIPVPAPETELLTALGSLHAKTEIATSVSAGYVDLPPSSTSLRISMQINRDAFSFDPEDGPQKSELDVIGAAVDDRGVIATFKQVLTVTNGAEGQDRSAPVVWNQQLTVPAGLYQVRVAVRERTTGRIGSAIQWIEVPDLSKGRFNLSSLFLGERRAEAQGTSGPQPVTVDVDHRFSRSSVLRFQTYVYNSSRGPHSPDVWIQGQLLHDKRKVIALPATRVPTENSSDQARLPYWAEIGLGELSPGRYTLVVTATDRSTSSNATQRINFVVD